MCTQTNGRFLQSTGGVCDKPNFSLGRLSSHPHGVSVKSRDVSSLCSINSHMIFRHAFLTCFVRRSANALWYDRVAKRVSEFQEHSSVSGTFQCLWIFVFGIFRKVSGNVPGMFHPFATLGMTGLFLFFNKYFNDMTHQETHLAGLCCFCNEVNICDPGAQNQS